MGRKAKAPPPEEVEEQEIYEESSDNDLEIDDTDEPTSVGDSQASSPATFHEGVELLKLLADHGYDVEGSLTDGIMTFTFSSKSHKSLRKRSEKLQDEGQHNARFANCSDLSRNEYKLLASASSPYKDSSFRDDQSVKSKKGSSKRVSIANWVKT